MLILALPAIPFSVREDTPGKAAIRLADQVV